MYHGRCIFNHFVLTNIVLIKSLNQCYYLSYQLKKITYFFWCSTIYNLFKYISLIKNDHIILMSDYWRIQSYFYIITCEIRHPGVNLAGGLGKSNKVSIGILLPWLDCLTLIYWCKFLSYRCWHNFLRSELC